MERVMVCRRRASVVASLVPALVLASGTAYAYRPFDSTDADVAARGEFELELGPVGFLRSGQDRSLVLSNVVANLGVYDRVELVLQGAELVNFDRGPRGSLQDAAALVKILLREGVLQGGTGPSIATELGAILPTLDGDSGVGASADVIVSERASPGTVHLNVQGARTRAGNPDLFVGTILEGPYEWKARPVAELFYEREFGTTLETFSGLVGFIGRASDRLSFDAATRIARSQGMPVFEARAGFTWSLDVWGGTTSVPTP